MCGTTKALLSPCGVSPIKNDMHIYRGNVYRGYCVHINTIYILKVIRISCHASVNLRLSVSVK